jgi:hypothetical protein
MRNDSSPFSEHMRKKILLAATLFLGVQGAIQAASLSWNGSAGNGLWHDAENWTPAQVPTEGDILTLGNSSPNAPQNISLGTSGTTSRLILNSTGNRTYTIGENGTTLNFRQSGTLTAQISWNSSTLRNTVTIDSNIFLSRDEEAEDAALTISSGAGDTTLILNGTLQGSTGTGYGSRTLTIATLNRTIINGTNSLDKLLWTRGEIVAGSTSALGAGWVQIATGGQTMLSLRNDVVVGVNVSEQSWLSNQETFLRISEATSGTASRTLTMTGALRMTNGGEGKLTFVDNENNDSGKVILNLVQSGGQANNVSIQLNSNAIVRFAQEGTKTQEGVISGTNGGQVEFVNGGTTTFSVAHTYNGKTVIHGSTLLLSVNGSIDQSAEINLGTTDSQGTLNVAAKAAFATGENQKVSGFGTINIGAGKTVTIAGELAPGNSTGRINVTGDLSLANTTKTSMELAGLGGVAGDDFDNITVAGTLTYDGSLSIVGFGGYNIHQEGTYNLFDFTAWSGNFEAVTFGGKSLEFASGIWAGTDEGYLLEFSLETGDLVVTAAIPEPHSVLLALGGMGLFAAARRRKSEAKARS